MGKTKYGNIKRGRLGSNTLSYCIREQTGENRSQTDDNNSGGEVCTMTLSIFMRKVFRKAVLAIGSLPMQSSAEIP
jgi:hypothetical protein